ncbi:hypothetical protein PANT_12c00087 [Moesziomyces antarcticus T-34]|uniref:Uncharacterized protein n=1 Tax=Pseudozyma antarctica (strain T-34) TaxID=1151754 RepID=M9LWH6_PSEA3|nr:hypothetical protein PANT_12c00087 [Moesziomyces antarcticus T-34]
MAANPLPEEEGYNFLSDVGSMTWDSLESARDYILEAANRANLSLRQTEWRPARGRAVYKCSFSRRGPCQFRIVITRERTAGERFTCTASGQHIGHDEGEPFRVRRQRPALSQWVRQQILSFDQILRRPGMQPIVLNSLQQHGLGPTVFRHIDIMPVDPATIGGHISLDRWYEGNGDGYEALDLIFNRGDSFVDIGLYVAQHLAEYEEIYGSASHFFLDAITALNEENTSVMSDDMAQFMVDRMGQALILCQVDPDIPGDSEITTLVPRFFPENGCTIANRCLINHQGGWSVGDWSLAGRSDGFVPLHGLPVFNSFWRERFWAKRNSAALVSGFGLWGVYASHDPFRNRPDLVR